VSDHTTHSEENRLPQQTLLEQILDRDNLKQAWARVRANKGAAGIDGMSVGDFPAFSQVHMLRIMDQIREGRYAPAPVKRVWIPKPDGSKRPLGIPTVLDRVSDKRVLRLIGKYLRAGVRLEDGSTEKTPKGVPQGGPLTPQTILQTITFGSDETRWA
jgi:retron-type reverse transcriptase